MSASPKSASPASRKRTRAPTGSTNRKQLTNDNTTTKQPLNSAPSSTLNSTTNSTTTSPTLKSPVPSRSKASPSPSSKTNTRSPTTSNVKSKLYQNTESSAMRTQTIDDDTRKKDKDSLDLLRVQFVETFDTRITEIKPPKRGSPAVTMPPTRFSCKPAHSDTHQLTIGEEGTPSHARDSDRFTTTKQQPQVDNSRQEYLEKERGRLERIRVNNARVEDVTKGENELQKANDNRRVQTVMRHQQQYKQAIDERIARGLD